MTPAHVDCPACPHCGLRVGVAYDRDERPLPAPTLWCPACGEQWQASAADRAQAERADAVHRLRERLTQVTGRDADDLRTVLDALARQTALATIHREERDACATEGYRLTQALDAAQRSAAQSAAAAVDAARDLGHVVAAQTERAEAAERECARLRHEAGQVHDLVVERDHYRERARTHGRRINELQSIGAAAMRQGLDACHRLRVRVAWHERLWRQELAHPRYGRMVNLARHYRDRMADAEALVADAMAAGLAECERLRAERDAVEALGAQAMHAAAADRDAAVARCTALAGAVDDVRKTRDAAATAHNALIDARDAVARKRYGAESRLTVAEWRHEKAWKAAQDAVAKVDALLTEVGDGR